MMNYNVYHSPIQKFVNEDIQVIVDKLKRFNPNVGESEINSWLNSLSHLKIVLCESKMPDDIVIILECCVPIASYKIDVVLAGKDTSNKDKIILIELKQWSNDYVKFDDGEKLTQLKVKYKKWENHEHPAIQVYRYKELLEKYNSSLENVKIIPIVFLHNYSDHNIKCTKRFSYRSDVNIFLNEKDDLIEFLKNAFKQGDVNYTITNNLLNGVIKPNKMLFHVLESILKGNKEFILDQNQLAAYNKVIKVYESATRNFNGLIIEGGPGTGKSVIAMNLLSYYTGKKISITYFTKTKAPREVYSSLLDNTDIKSNKNQLFSGNVNIHQPPEIILIDEAHRLTKEHVKKLIELKNTFLIFFIDDNQKVTCEDIGNKETLYNLFGNRLNQKFETKLINQYRCNSSDKYLNWLDNLLGIQNHTNINFSKKDFEFKIFDEIDLFYGELKEKNKQLKTRIVAGYCWEWKSRENSILNDICIKSFTKKWNLQSYPNNKTSASWIIQDSFEEVGCIHSSQGLEVDYIGVILGKDIYIEENVLKTNQKNNIELAKKNCPDVDKIIKNIYRVLMTRGTKGCYIYCVDKSLTAYFKMKLREIKYDSL